MHRWDGLYNIIQTLTLLVTNILLKWQNSGGGLGMDPWRNHEKPKTVRGSKHAEAKCQHVTSARAEKD